MTWDWWLTTLLAGIAALGVLVNEIRHRRRRPVIDVRTRAFKRNPAPGMFHGDGEWLMDVKNFGTVDALNVHIASTPDMAVYPSRDEGPPIARLLPGDRVVYSGTPTGKIEAAWVLVTFMTSSTPHGYAEWTWWPANEASALAAARVAQLTRGRLKRLIARLAFPDQPPSPYTFAAMRRPSLSAASLTYVPGQSARYRTRRLFIRLLREPVPSVLAPPATST